jgi:hypothetical protein
VEVTSVNASENSSVTYPIVKIPGVDVKLDVEFTGVGKDLDAEPTGVKVDTGAYSSMAYDAVPQDQGKKIKVYGLGQQVPTKAQSKEGKKHKVALTLTRVKHMKHKTAMSQGITLMLKLMIMVMLTDTAKVGVTKALPTKKGGVDAEIAMEYETLYWHRMTSKQKEHVLDTVHQEMAQGNRVRQGASVREDLMLTRDRVSTTDHALDRG